MKNLKKAYHRSLFEFQNEGHKYIRMVIIITVSSIFISPDKVNTSQDIKISMLIAMLIYFTIFLGVFKSESYVNLLPTSKSVYFISSFINGVLFTTVLVLPLEILWFGSYIFTTPLGICSILQVFSLYVAVNTNNTDVIDPFFKGVILSMPAIIVIVGMYYFQAFIVVSLLSTLFCWVMTLKNVMCFKKYSVKGELLMLNVNNVYSRISSFEFGPLSITFEPGYVYGIFGLNGQGKTTLLNHCAMIWKPTEGVIKYKGMEDYREEIGHVSSDALLEGAAKLQTIANVYRDAYTTWDEDRFLDLIETFKLNINQKFRKLSEGNKQRFKVILALSHHPSLIVLDDQQRVLIHSPEKLLLKKYEKKS